MICAGSRVDEDPYDLVMRKADALKVTIVPHSGKFLQTSCCEIFCKKSSEIHGILISYYQGVYHG
jgi:hypothetical protein